MFRYRYKRAMAAAVPACAGRLAANRAGTRSAIENSVADSRSITGVRRSFARRFSVAIQSAFVQRGEAISHTSRGRCDKISVGSVWFSINRIVIISRLPLWPIRASARADKVSQKLPQISVEIDFSNLVRAEKPEF